MNSHVGNVYVPAYSNDVISPTPPFALNVTLYLTTGISSQIAKNSVSLSILYVKSVITSPALVVDQPLNCLPDGAVNSHTGNVYVPACSTDAISPVPPFALNDTLYPTTFTTIVASKPSYFTTILNSPIRSAVNT